MSKIKMVKPAITVYGAFNAGQVVDISDDMVRLWVEAGLAEPELTESVNSPRPGAFSVTPAFLISRRPVLAQTRAIAKAAMTFCSKKLKCCLAISTRSGFL